MKKSVALSIHFGLWFVIYFLLSPAAVYFSYDVKLWGINYQILNAILISVFFILPAIVSFYAMFFYTPKIIEKRWKLVFPISIYIIFILISMYYARNGVEVKGFFILRYLIVSSFVFILLGGLFRIQVEWFKNKEEMHELEKQYNESKMALLRSQINPHFLFNTLNNIDTLIYENQDKASKSLIKLSDIMRYMLKDGKTDFIDLEKEMKHLESYLALEHLRLKNDKFLNYSVSGDYRVIKIAPMILIPFVENAFKHSVDSDIENGIIIKITCESKILNFNCKNQFDKTETDKDKGHGIGLENVKKRLNLIYENKYKLTIRSDKSVFNVNLELDLNEN